MRCGGMFSRSPRRGMDGGVAAHLSQKAPPATAQHPLPFIRGTVGELSCPKTRQTWVERDFTANPLVIGELALPSEPQCQMGCCLTQASEDGGAALPIGTQN